MKTPNDLISFLREQTSKEHALIEGAIPVFKNDFETPEYAALLRRLYGFYRPFEFSVRPKVEGVESLRWSDRQKVPWLVEDLIELDRSTDLDSIELCASRPHLTSLSSALGALYVTEGSTLGGSVIERHLRAKFQFQNRPLRFFSSHGAKTKTRWREFLNVIETQVTPEQFVEAAEAAQATFQSLRKWLTSESQS